jgi:hypothetical protein
MPGTLTNPHSSFRVDCVLQSGLRSLHFYLFTVVCSVVCIATRLRAGWSGVRIPGGERDFILNVIHIPCGCFAYQFLLPTTAQQYNITGLRPTKIEVIARRVWRQTFIFYVLTYYILISYV